MARINVNPNRMELSKLKKRLVVARRGHKLLKDKQDALIKAFLERARAGKTLREKVEAELQECYGTFAFSRAQTTPEILEQALIFPGARCTLSVAWRNVMSVIVPEYEVHQEGSTFTISNLGMYGVESFTSIINQPNSAILSIAGTKEMPVVRNGEVVIRPIMKMSLTSDHRVINGLAAAKFMQELKATLESPLPLLV